MNPIYEAILTRRTIHDYTDSPLPEGALSRALEAARWAPNHKLTNPWRFTILGPQARADIAALAVSLKCPDRAEDDPVALKVREKFLNPAALIVVSQVVDEDPARAMEDYAAIACALQNMSLALHAEGVGTKWSSGAITTHDRTRELAQLPEAERCVGFMWVGYAQREPRQPPRLELEQIVRQVP